MSSIAFYFPVEPTPLRMQAGLLRFGTDFGNGEVDARFFQIDDERLRYLAAKRESPAHRHVIAGVDEAAERARKVATRWMRETLSAEAPHVLSEIDAERDARDELDAIARHVQEDFAVLATAIDGVPDDGRVVALDVRFPSGWRPEVLAEASFSKIHVPVPGFAKDDRVSRSMMTSMLKRGPYVRFVWTVSADDALDHHPDSGLRRSFEGAECAWLRVERQVSVPLDEGRATVFLIRTYLYEISTLERDKRDTLREALRVMPEPLRAYKKLPTLVEYDRMNLF
jgi:hypothetical protein